MGLLIFYKWIVILGSLSGISVIIMEFISPFGFGDYVWLVFAFPISFISSYKVIQKYNQHLNLTLALMNLSLGFFMDILLVMYLESDILFLAGLTVALV